MIFLLAILLGGDVRFEADGLRVGGELLRGNVVELRDGLLASARVVEPLSAPVTLSFDGLRLTLDPGVRAERDGDVLRLSAHAPAWLRMSNGTSGETIVLKRGELSGELGVSILQQDDPEAQLRAMEESARRMRESGNRVRPPIRRRVFSGSNPFTSSEPAGSEATRQLVQVSPSGF